MKLSLKWSMDDHRKDSLPLEFFSHHTSAYHNCFFHKKSQWIIIWDNTLDGTFPVQVPSSVAISVALTL